MRIFLVGLPGAGKSHWGKIWAAEQQVDFIDLDHHIEIASGSTIKELFVATGEYGFREWENRVLMEIILKRDNFVMACGGGTPCFADNMEVMNRLGLTIFINPDIEHIRINLLYDDKIRPLLEDFTQVGLASRLQQMLDERMRYYSKATLTLTAAELHPEALKKITSKPK
jgi:shikimate kinase